VLIADGHLFAAEEVIDLFKLNSQEIVFGLLA
jgi:hypothetical protein